MSDTKVYSEYPVIVQYVGGRGKGEGSSSMDGSTNPKQVLAFQKWVNKFKFKKKLIAEDAKWGPKTSAAWNQFGSEYVSAGQKVAGIVDSFGNQFNQQSSGTSSETATEKTSLLDKALGLFGKGKEAVGKVKSAADKVKGYTGGAASDDGGFSSDAVVEEPKTNNTKKILIWSGVAITAGVLIYLATRKTTKA